MKYYCHDCGRTFDEDEEDIICVAEQTWDSPAEYEGRCPYCGSEDYEEAKVCEFCGEPIDPDTKLNFCEDCEEYFTYMFEQMIEHMADEWGCPKDDIQAVFLEFIAEKY